MIKIKARGTALQTIQTPAGGASGPAPQPGNRERVLLLLFALSAGLVFLNRAGISFVFPEMRADIHLTNAQFGLLVSITALTWGLSSIVFSFVSDRLGGRPKLVISICVLGFSIVALLGGVVSTFGALLALRGAMGVFEGPVIPLIQSIVMRTWPQNRLGATMGFVMGGAAVIGGVFAPAIMGGLTALAGWRHAFFYVAIPGFILALLLVLILPTDRNLRANAESAHPSLKDAFGQFADRNVFLALIGAMLVIGYAVSLHFLPAFLASDPTISPATRAVMLTAIGFAAAAGTVFAPALSDRIGRKQCLLLAALGMALSPLFLIYVPGHHLFLVPALVAGFVGGGAMTLMVYVIPGETVPASVAATVYAMLLCFGELLGGSTAPALAGVLADRFGLAAALCLTVVLGSLTFIVALGVREPKRRDVSLPGFEMAGGLAANSDALIE